ncbi:MULTISPECIES: glycerophosphodiester phosphodiesterase [Pseudidiomarina]|uniref:glycerophosphodiester phosphodiesterase n=2 Tax=Pseudidiomarina TaxID=2800384 RepID=A0A368UUY1_9GAMM|nr:MULTISPECIES: glycerophosphodiester phosphodiesterase [Pseudidiomarina]PWW13326.1 glycerophosphoryl diester phosphodiesterase [Pseudidiomarina maritima]RBP90793.1 glycerophosphoryl diester phosphodiesterase [Pseudidiomarina tainanensis]RCW32589.1 glycerophosphoryl diester phosphodiesterase [Pseudidiomarina tainanensis]
MVSTSVKALPALAVTWMSLLSLFILPSYAAIYEAENQPQAAAESVKKGAPLTIIAHRGASGYAPEHSLAAVAIAFAQGADYIEQDVVLTRDHVPVVLHDLQLDAVSNVAEVFPDKKRPNGHYYALDFTFAELQQLNFNERSEHTKAGAKGSAKQQYPARFPHDKGRFRVMSLAESIELVQGLNHSFKRNTGIYVELKNAPWHQQQNYDLPAAVMQVLGKYGYTDPVPATPIYLQSFDPEVLRRLKREFLTEIPLIQLIADNRWNQSSVDYNLMLTAAGLETLSSYADGVGIWLDHLYQGPAVQSTDALAPAATAQSSTAQSSWLAAAQRWRWREVVPHAHQAGLKVHVYTLRADQLPSGFASYEELKKALTELGVDGIFTDFPDL